MKYSLIIEPQAELDLLESAQWYELQKPGLGSRFIEAVEDKFIGSMKTPISIRQDIKRPAWYLLNASRLLYITR